MTRARWLLFVDLLTTVGGAVRDVPRAAAAPQRIGEEVHVQMRATCVPVVLLSVAAGGWGLVLARGLPGDGGALWWGLALGLRHLVPLMAGVGLASFAPRTSFHHGSTALLSGAVAGGILAAFSASCCVLAWGTVDVVGYRVQPASWVRGIQEVVVPVDVVTCVVKAVAMGAWAGLGRWLFTDFGSAASVLVVAAFGLTEAADMVAVAVDLMARLQ